MSRISTRKALFYTKGWGNISINEITMQEEIYFKEVFGQKKKSKLPNWYVWSLREAIYKAQGISHV